MDDLQRERVLALLLDPEPATAPPERESPPSPLAPELEEKLVDVAIHARTRESRDA